MMIIIIINANTVTWNFLRLTKYLMRLMTRIAVLCAFDSLKKPWHSPV